MLELLFAIDRLDDDVNAAREIPLTDLVRIDAARLRAGVTAIRAAADAQFSAEREGAIGELFEALEALAAAAAEAKPVPLTDQVRLNRDRFYDRLDAVRRGAPYAVAQQQRGSGPWVEVLEQVNALAHTVDAAGRSTFTRKVKLDAAALRDAAARMRIAAMRGFEPGDRIFTALDELDELVREGPQTGETAVSAGTIHRLLGELRDATLGT